MSSVASLFVDAVRRFPDRVLLRPAHGPSLRYRESAARVAAVVEKLGTLGLRAGDHVVCFLDQPIPSVLFSLACAHAGVVPVPLSPSFSVAVAEQLIAQVGARFVFTTVEHAARLIERGIHPLCFLDEGAPPPGGIEPLATSPLPTFEAATSALARAAAGRSGDDVCVLQPTSGTTGRFKLVVRNHATLLRFARQYAIDLVADDEPPQRMLLVAASTHGMGQYIILTAVRLGAELVIPSRIDTGASLEEVRALDPTMLYMTPRVLRSFHQQYRQLGGDGAQPIFGPGARVLLSGGSMPDLALLRLVASQGIDVLEAYGCSETSLLAMTRRGHWREGYVGPIFDDVTLRLADDGELLASSAGQMLGYFGDPELTRSSYTDDGLFRTGDFCAITPDGYLRYLGRKRDVFNTPEGSNIHPTRIEDLVERFDWVAQVVLIGDQRPYLSALLVTVDAAADPADGDALPPTRCAAAYERAREALAALNLGLEAIERVRRFAILARPMPPELYRRAGHGKIARDRRAIEARFRDVVSALYAPDPTGDATVEEG